MRVWRKRLIAAPWIAILSACAVTPVSKPPVSDVEQAWVERQAALTGLAGWKVNGRIAGRTEDSGWSANFQWTQRGYDYHLSLNGPLGQGRVELDGNTLGVSMQLPDQQLVTATDPADLLYQRTGWRLPVEALRFWLRGLPVSAPIAKRLDDQGRLATLDQLDWQLNYQQYMPIGNLELPAKLTLSKADMRIRFVIDEWQVTP